MNAENLLRTLGAILFNPYDREELERYGLSVGSIEVDRAEESIAIQFDYGKNADGSGKMAFGILRLLRR